MRLSMLCLLLADSPARDRAGSMLHAVQLSSLLCNQSGTMPPRQCCEVCLH